MKLTEVQLNFIVNTFFTINKFPGSAASGHKLLTEGEAIIAGEKSLWDGRKIDRFIKTEKAKDVKGCLHYKLDLDGFMQSELFRDELSIALYKARKTVQQAVNEHRELKSLIKKEKE